MTTEEEETGKRRFKTLRSHSWLVGSVYWMAFLSFLALAAYIGLVQKEYITLPQPTVKFTVPYVAPPAHWTAL
jgi:hypothetical protein